ncbi:MAG: ATP-binding protein [Undibacterium sp.]|uniref:ATP-binding protein n=1 Tax=Undibacterium sp. TaxID=1914977 RepID=UPI002719C882|nr:ATP-binding protein [Undibacterium sp.]MDO8652720.1 ATP-binding protein [Undibacterium sp.]
MKRIFSDTIFSRLFGLAMAAVIVSHIMTFVLLFVFLGEHLPPHPPGRVDEIGHHSVPASASYLSDSPRLPPPRHEGGLMSGPFLGFFVSMMLQLIILAMAAWWGSRSLAKPLQGLAQAARQIGDKLNPPALLESGPAEVRQAAQVFNQMQQKISDQMTERGRFLASVSHDLRTPLTRMYLRVEHLDDGIAKAKLQQDIEEMRHMLDATLDYLRNNGQTADLTQLGQSLDIQALLEALVDDAKEQGKELSLTGEAKLIMAIPSDLRRCLSNLLENALHYGKCARITLHDSEKQLVIRISDQGQGIPEDALQQVFEPFYRLSSSRSKNNGGVGLGLSIAREIVRQHAGELILFNNPEGIGLTAQITLTRMT